MPWVPTSTAFEEGGSRIDDLKLIISRVAYAASLFDQDGIQVRLVRAGPPRLFLVHELQLTLKLLQVRFMNSRVEGNGINSEAAAMQLVNQVKFSGLTPLGTALDSKILQPLVMGPARQGRLTKPVLIIAVTDGVPGGEDRYAIVKAIIAANRELARTRYGSDALSYQLAQVGNDQKARAFLEEIDKHPEVGGLVDVSLELGKENQVDTLTECSTVHFQL